ncbi:MAG: prephenate/arogenate dehydrogenase family protein [Pseudomonadota bacterium]|nr:prephenate/arogenate dehydrogenase family protein [Pseudomonadota bacterium]
MTESYKKIAIIGLGLIGGSIGLAVNRYDKSIKRIGIARTQDTLDKALERGLVDEVSNQFNEILIDCDLVILATPLSSFKSIIEEILPYLKEGCVITDTGSSKTNVIKVIEELIPDHINFVAGHPVAGTEMSGPEAGFAELFDNRWCILTPTEKTNKETLEDVSNFWKNLGAMTEVMTAEHHDKVLAITSHIPHLLAFNIVGTANDLANVTEKEVVKYSAGGFRDFTRIAASDPIMWRDIFISNSSAVLEMLNYFSKDLDDLKTAIENNDSDFLEDFFNKTKEVRINIIEAGQDTKKPDFGRYSKKTN